MGRVRECECEQFSARFFDIFFLFIVHTPQVMSTIVVACINRNRDEERLGDSPELDRREARLKIRKSDNKKSLKYNQDSPARPVRHCDGRFQNRIPPPILISEQSVCQSGSVIDDDCPSLTAKCTCFALLLPAAAVVAPTSGACRVVC